MKKVMTVAMMLLVSLSFIVSCGNDAVIEKINPHIYVENGGSSVEIKKGSKSEVCVVVELPSGYFSSTIRKGDSVKEWFNVSDDRSVEDTIEIVSANVVKIERTTKVSGLSEGSTSAKNNRIVVSLKINGKIATEYGVIEVILPKGVIETNGGTRKSLSPINGDTKISVSVKSDKPTPPGPSPIDPDKPDPKPDPVKPEKLENTAIMYRVKSKDNPTIESDGIETTKGTPTSLLVRIDLGYKSGDFNRNIVYEEQDVTSWFKEEGLSSAIKNSGLKAKIVSEIYTVRNGKKVLTSVVASVKFTPQVKTEDDKFAKLSVAPLLLDESGKSIRNDATEKLVTDGEVLISVASDSPAPKPDPEPVKPEKKEVSVTPDRLKLVSHYYHTWGSGTFETQEVMLTIENGF